MKAKDLVPRLRPRVRVLTDQSESVFLSSDAPLGRGRRTDADSLICSLGHCECDGHAEHKLSQRRLTADLLAPRESDSSRKSSKVSSDWLPSSIKATRPVLEKFKMAGYIPDSLVYLFIYLLRSVSLVFFHISLDAAARTRLRDVCFCQNLTLLTVLEDFSAAIYRENLKYYVTWSLLLKYKHVTVLPNTYCFCYYI
jgi:hypothetical protein